MKSFPMLKKTREAVHKILKALKTDDTIAKLISYKTTIKPQITKPHFCKYIYMVYACKLITLEIY